MEVSMGCKPNGCLRGQRSLAAVIATMFLAAALAAWSADPAGPTRPDAPEGGAAVSIQVYPSSAPNAYGSPSYPGWVANAVYALENDLATWGDNSLPTYYQRITVMTDRDNIVTGFMSWKGYADPGTVFGPAFASELGNRATYGVH